MKTRTLVYLVTLTLLLLPTTAFGQILYGISAGAGVDDFGENLSDSESAFVGIAQASVVSSRGSYADATATWGVLRLAGEVTSVNQPNPQPGVPQSYFAGARFHDFLTINSPGKFGTDGFVTIAYRLDGSIGFQGAPDPQYPNDTRGKVGYVSRMFVNGASDITEYGIFDDGSFGPDADILNLTQTFQVPITFGFSFIVDWFVTTDGRVNSRVPSSAFSALNQTGTWQGIPEVTDALGQPVAFTVSATSGTDYGSALPEPGTGSLIVIAMAFLGRWRRGAR